MAYKRIEDRQKIIKIIDHLIAEKSDIQVIMKSGSTSFTSRIINANQNYPSLAKGTRAVIIIEKLAPEKGNDLIQVSPRLTLKFTVLDQPCACLINYIGISSMPPYFGFVLGMPEVIELEEKRVETRSIYGSPDFLTAVIRIGKAIKAQRVYELDVVDSSAHGLRMLIREKNLDLLDRVKVGDVIKDINFYASNAMLKVDGIVRHITKITEGKFKGGYYIGIESKDIIPGAKKKK
ncbi:MAG: hypothetical protein JW944_00835 [Deltaproteobacteria bacterium]|nr:hypothetical protein [Deltaproteobacteria bacterium]